MKCDAGYKRYGRDVCAKGSIDIFHSFTLAAFLDDTIITSNES